MDRGAVAASFALCDAQMRVGDTRNALAAAHALAGHVPLDADAVALPQLVRIAAGEAPAFARDHKGSRAQHEVLEGLRQVDRVAFLAIGGWHCGRLVQPYQAQTGIASTTTTHPGLQARPCSMPRESRGSAGDEQPSTPAAGDKRVLGPFGPAGVERGVGRRAGHSSSAGVCSLAAFPGGARRPRGQGRGCVGR